MGGLLSSWNALIGHSLEYSKYWAKFSLSRSKLYVFEDPPINAIFRTAFYFLLRKLCMIYKGIRGLIVVECSHRSDLGRRGVSPSTIIHVNQIFNTLINPGTFINEILRKVYIEKNQRVPADLVLLRTTEKSGTCFVRTDQLDGETDWKLRMAVQHTQKLESDARLLEIQASLFAEKPQRDIHSFIGTFSRVSAGSLAFLFIIDHIYPAFWFPSCLP